MSKIIVEQIKSTVEKDVSTITFTFGETIYSMTVAEDPTKLKSVTIE